MFPVFLLAAAVGIIAVALLFLFWRNVDRRIQQADSDHTVEDLTEQLQQALEQQQHLTSRVEHLEAIVASEPWEAARKQIARPPDQADASPEQQAALPDRRQQSR